MKTTSINNPANRDTLFSAWSLEKPVLSFTEIVNHLHEKGIVKKKHHKTVSNWLKKLIKEKIVKKVQDGYKLMLKPEEYQLFNYLSNLRNKYEGYVYHGEVGGILWKMCMLNILGFPTEIQAQIFKDQEADIALNMLLIRLGEIFGALEALRNIIVERMAGLPVSMVDIIDREVFFAFLTKSINEEGTTDQLMSRYKKNLKEHYNIGYKSFFSTPYSHAAKTYFAHVDGNSSQHLSDGLKAYVENTEMLRQILRNVEDYKERLEKEGFHVDKHNLKGPQGLIERYFRASEKLETEKHSHKDVEVWHQLRDAILVKAAENLNNMGGFDLDDFAIIITRHPSTMDRYYTAEHTLYDAMKWAFEEPKSEYPFLKRGWLREKKKLKTLEAVIANHLFGVAHHSVEEYRALRRKPWVIKELCVRADFDEILRIYEKKVVERTEKEREFLKSVECKTKGKEPVDINEEVGKSDFDKKAERI